MYSSSLSSPFFFEPGPCKSRFTAIFSVEKSTTSFPISLSFCVAGGGGLSLVAGAGDEIMTGVDGSVTLASGVSVVSGDPEP